MSQHKNQEELRVELTRSLKPLVGLVCPDPTETLLSLERRLAQALDGSSPEPLGPWDVLPLHKSPEKQDSIVHVLRLPKVFPLCPALKRETDRHPTPE
jgi:hypothetical protein